MERAMTTAETTGSDEFPPHILIVDDERSLRRTLRGLFQKLGYRTAEAASGQEALALLTEHTFDLVLLDLNLPGMSGTAVLEAARPLAPDTVFIILTAHGTLDSAIAAIRHGAFDYLLKPSKTEEIIRAVESGLAERRRRLASRDPVALLEQALATLKTAPLSLPPAAEGSSSRFLQADGVTVDTLRRTAFVDGHPVDLTPTEFDILAYLLSHADRVVSCRELVFHLRGYEVDEREARLLLRSHIHRLRRKLEPDPARPTLIQTVRGQGYTIRPSDVGGDR